MINSLRYWKHIKITLLICLLLILCSCVFHEQYPPDWAPLVKASEDCLTIIGIYNDYTSPSMPFLSYFLTGQELKAPNLNKTNYVQINRGGNHEFIVTVWNEHKKLAEKIYKKKEYMCTDEGIEISKGVEVTTEWVLGLGRDKIMLIKAADGSLVVKYQSGGVGLFGALVPVAVDNIQYQKYSRRK